MACEAGAWIIFLLCGAALLLVKMQASVARNAGFGNETSGIVHAQVSTTVNSIHEQEPTDSPGADNDFEAKVMGRLEIKAVGLVVPIFDNFDPSSLRKGVGHIHGTALPGGLGNMAVAGHRDTFFRPLRNIQKGMTMSVSTAGGRYEYVVDSMEIVSPEQVSVLAIHDIPELTLITCYPFEFIGSAPQRFIVRAHLMSIEPMRN